jgi:hypothetical protein
MNSTYFILFLNLLIKYVIIKDSKQLYVVNGYTVSWRYLS